MQIEKALINERLVTCFKSTLKILYSNYLQFCSNLGVKVSIVFPVYKILFFLNNLKIRTAINVKISVFVICIKAIIYLLLYNKSCDIMVIIITFFFSTNLFKHFV